jgi:hypothetical protein
MKILSAPTTRCDAPLAAIREAKSSERAPVVGGFSAFSTSSLTSGCFSKRMGQRPFVQNAFGAPVSPCFECVEELISAARR